MEINKHVMTVCTVMMAVSALVGTVIVMRAEPSRQVEAEVEYHPFKLPQGTPAPIPNAHGYYAVKLTNTADNDADPIRVEMPSAVLITVTQERKYGRVERPSPQSWGNVPPRAVVKLAAKEIAYVSAWTEGAPACEVRYLEDGSPVDKTVRAMARPFDRSLGHIVRRSWPLFFLLVPPFILGLDRYVSRKARKPAPKAVQEVPASPATNT
jgi:hypothetical protein